MNPELTAHLESTESAGFRTRTVIVALIVACVLGLIGFLNSWKYGWIPQRARKVAYNDSYSAHRLGLDNATPLGEEPKLVGEQKEHAKAFSLTLIDEYAKNGFQNRVPFFGTVVDVYDFGLVGGIGYATILLLLFYSLNTEKTALRLAFSAATKGNISNLAEFYAILATRQLLTIPRTANVTARNTTPPDHLPLDNHWTFCWLRLLPKTLILLPGFVYFPIIIYDFFTWDYGWYVSPGHFIALVVYSLFFASLISMLIWKCWQRLGGIDQIWDYWHNNVFLDAPADAASTSGEATCFRPNTVNEKSIGKCSESNGDTTANLTETISTTPGATVSLVTPAVETSLTHTEQAAIPPAPPAS